MEANLSLMYVISLFSVLIAFAFAAYLFLWVRRQKSTNARINEVAALIKEGANTFMRKEYRVLSIFAGIAAVIIFLLLPSPVWTGHPGRNLSMAAAYVAGTALSAIAGKIGILVATNANARAAEGARQGVRPAFLIGFRGGAVMGLAVVGFSLLGVCGVRIVWVYTAFAANRTFDTLLLAYPLSLAVTAALLLGALLFYRPAAELAKENAAVR